MSASYTYRATDAAGRVQTGRIAASGTQHIARLLSEQGLELITCAPLPQHRLFMRERGGDLKSQQLLFLQLATLTGAGVPLAQACEDAGRSLPSGRLSAALSGMSARIGAGEAVADAMAEPGSLFSPTVVALVRAGQARGDLAHGFQLAADHLAWSADRAGALSRALRYPVFLLLLVGGVMSFMVGHVLPDIAAFLSEENGEIPPYTRALLVFAQIGSVAGLCILGAVALTAMGTFLAAQTPKGRLILGRVALRAPLIGPLLAAQEEAMFLHHFSVLMEGGADLLVALSSARRAARNPAFSESLERAERAIAAGVDLADALGATDLFDNLTLRLVRIGLAGNTLPDHLAQASVWRTQDAQRRGAQIIGATGPVLTLLAGGLLAWIVAAVIVPLYGNLAAMGAP